MISENLNSISMSHCSNDCIIMSCYMCKYCELFAPDLDNSTPYVSCGAVLGSQPSRRLESYDSSRQHLESVQRYTSSLCNVSVANKVLAASENSKNAVVTRNHNYMKKLFQTCCFLISKTWVLTENFQDVITFMGRTSDPQIAEVLKEDVTYTSFTSVTELVTIISDYLEQQLLSDLRTPGQKITLLADESTDSANGTQLSIFARWIGSSRAVEHYIDLFHVEQTNSEASMGAITAFCPAKGIELSNARFVRLDGCNTMSGQRKGLQKRIRHLSQLCIDVNCRNDRLALCLVHMLKNNPLLAEVDAVLIAIWKLFQYSPRRQVFLNQSGQCMARNHLSLSGQQQLGMIV